MFTAIVYHNAIEPLLNDLVDSLVRSECDHNKFIFLNTHGDTTLGDKAMKKLPKSESFSIDVEQIDRRPINSAWKYIAKIAHDLKEDFLFLDADVVFFAKNGIDILYDEFLQKNCRVCGTLLHDHHGIKRALPPVIRERAGGLHCIGVAFFDQDIIEIATSIYSCPDTVPYDIWCKEHFLAHFSASYYQSQRVKDNVENLDFLAPDAFFHHGCKDSSLWELVKKTDHWAMLPQVIAPEPTL